MLAAASTSAFDGALTYRNPSSTHHMKKPFGIRVLTWFVVLASAGMFVSILLAILDVGPHFMGGERVTRSEWLHIAAPLVAVLAG